MLCVKHSCTALQELWGVSKADMPAVLSMFAAVSMLKEVPGPGGAKYVVSNLAHDYLAYWARMSGKGATVGGLQKWLLSHQVRRGFAVYFPSSAKVAHLLCLIVRLPLPRR